MILGFLLWVTPTPSTPETPKRDNGPLSPPLCVHHMTSSKVLGSHLWVRQDSATREFMMRLFSFILKSKLATPLYRSTVLNLLRFDSPDCVKISSIGDFWNSFLHTLDFWNVDNSKHLIRGSHSSGYDGCYLSWYYKCWNTLCLNLSTNLLDPTVHGKSMLSLREFQPFVQVLKDSWPNNLAYFLLRFFSSRWLRPSSFI
jgi:hypothetical protein